MAITIVALNNTFDEWRTRTNQLITQSNYYETNLPNYSYANNIGVSANSFASATIAGANTAVGTGANAYTNLLVTGANANASNATYLTIGIVPTARMSGSYTGITGLGTITTGAWNGTVISTSYGGTGASDAGTARTNLGLAIGTNVQAYSARLGEIAALAPTDNNFIVGNGSAWTLETPASARTSLGLGTIATQAASSVSITGGSITGITDLAVVDGGTGASDAGTARTNLGLGTIATQAASSVSITGGSITGITDLAVADGGTGASDAGTARTNLGLGTIATQASSSVSISGGSISGLSSLAVSGAITATGDITAFLSDARLKGDIQIITDALSKVNLITGITYRHNELAKSFGYTDENRFAGVLAQEVEVVLPEVVVPAPFDVADDGTSKSGENYKTVKYEKIIPLLIEAIKELTAKVEMLESKAGK